MRKRRKLHTERRKKEDTALRAVSPPSLYLSRFILLTSHEASGEVFVFPLSPISGKERKLLGIRGTNEASLLLPLYERSET